MSAPAKVHHYTSAEAKIAWDASRCIHAAECVHRAPQAFDPQARPWIQPERSDAATLADAVNRCPSGALSMWHADGTSAMTVPPVNTGHVTAGGPTYLRGKLTLRDGETVIEDTRIALCRCGASKNKPYCDNSHKTLGFADPGALPFAKAAPPDADMSGPLTIKPKQNGPVQIDGPLTLTGADGRAAFSDQTFLCRCGGSQNKPYCDGTHRKIGFTS
jgi:CDGSH-type Zn-finger protein/uncharacterized Fe-S cluster protein YjdI